MRHPATPACPVCGDAMYPSPSMGRRAWLCANFCGGVITEERLGDIRKAKWESEQPIRDADKARRKAEWKAVAESLPWAYRSKQVRTLWSVEGKDGWFVESKSVVPGVISAADPSCRRVLVLRQASERDVLTRCQAAEERKQQKRRG